MSCLAIRVKHIWVKIQHPPEESGIFIISIFDLITEAFLVSERERNKQNPTK